MESVDGQRTE